MPNPVYKHIETKTFFLNSKVLKVFRQIFFSTCLTFLSWHKDSVTVVSSSKKLRSLPCPNDSPSSTTKLDRKKKENDADSAAKKAEKELFVWWCRICTLAECRWEVWTGWFPCWSAPSPGLHPPDTTDGKLHRCPAQPGSPHHHLTAQK